jgi:hypothetical protein
VKRRQLEPGERFGYLEVIGPAKPDKHRHPRVLIFCHKCHKGKKKHYKVMRSWDLIRKATRSSKSGRIRKSNLTCGCDSKAQFTKKRNERIEKTSLKKQLDIWSRAQQNGTTVTAAKGNSLQKCVNDEIVRRIDAEFQRLAKFADSDYWFDRCSSWQDEFERDERDRSSARAKYYYGEPSPPLTPKEIREEGRSSRWAGFSQDEIETMRVEIEKAKKIIQRWGHWRRVFRSVKQDVWRARRIRFPAYLELAHWIVSTYDSTIANRRSAQKRAIKASKAKELRNRATEEASQRAYAEIDDAQMSAFADANPDFGDCPPIE